MRSAVILGLLLPALLAAETSLLRVRVLDNDGAGHPAGSRSAGISVEVTDELGKAVPGAAVTVRLPDDGPGGAFANGVSTAILTTGPDGRATTTPITWNRLAGPVEIRIAAVSGPLRAETVARRLLSEPQPEKHGPRVVMKPQPSGGGHLKWILIGAATAGAAAATLGLRSSGGAHGGQQSSGSAEAPLINPSGSPTVGPHP
jgi:hypothetical protein